MKFTGLILLLVLATTAARAQLAVTVAPVKIAGQKALVPLAMKNNLPEKVESARAVCFLLDENGKVVGNASRWVIGGSRDKTGLAARATNVFNFVITSDKPFTTTNLTAKISFSRVVMEGGKLADVAKEVQIQTTSK